MMHSFKLDFIREVLIYLNNFFIGGHACLFGSCFKTILYFERFIRAIMYILVYSLHVVVYVCMAKDDSVNTRRNRNLEILIKFQNERENTITMWKSV